MLNVQMLEQKEYKKKVQAERIQLQNDIKKVIIEDKREKERIRLEVQQKVLNEKRNRDMQISLKLKAKEIEVKEQKRAEERQIEILQKEIKEEKKQNYEKRKNEMDECKKIIE